MPQSDPRTGRRRWLVLAAVIVLAACAPVSSGGAAVQVELVDNAITLEPARAPDGSVDLEIANEGDLVHEVEIFAGADPGETLDVSNSVADTRGLRLVDEVEDVLPSTTARLVVDLDPGTYLVICNLPGHYQQGMSAYLTVEPAASSDTP